MTDAGLFAIALAIYFGLRTIAAAIEKRKLDVVLKLGTVNFVHRHALADEDGEAGHA